MVGILISVYYKKGEVDNTAPCELKLVILVRCYVFYCIDSINFSSEYKFLSSF